MKIFIQYVFMLIFVINSPVFAKKLGACECVNNLQIECDETLTTAGVNRCFGDCDCSKGRHCLQINNHRPTGVCVDDKEYKGEK